MSAPGSQVTDGSDTGGFQGVLADVGLLDVLQVFRLSRRTTVLEIEGPVTGEIGLLDGELVCARCGELAGRQALRAFLKADRGTIRAVSTTPEDRDFDGSFDAIVIDVLREIDEDARQDGAEAGPASPKGGRFSVVPPGPTSAPAAPPATPGPRDDGAGWPPSLLERLSALAGISGALGSLRSVTVEAVDGARLRAAVSGNDPSSPGWDLGAISPQPSDTAPSSPTSPLPLGESTEALLPVR